MSNFPHLFQFSGGKAELNPNFVNYNETVQWSPERAIEKLRKQSYDILFRKDIENGKITHEFAEKKLQSLNHTYGSVKHKFQNIDRNNGGRYFDHQFRIANNILTKSTNASQPTLRKILIALHHDSIEDTDIDFHTLETTLNEKIGLGVLIISKKPFTEFARNSISNKKDLSQEQIDKIKRWGILDEKGNILSRQYLEKKYYFPYQVSGEELLLENAWIESLSDRQKFEMIDSVGILNKKGLLSDRFVGIKNFRPESITLEENFAYEMYDLLKKKYNERKNEEYFSHMVVNENDIIIGNVFRNTPNLNKFYYHALQIVKKYVIKIKIDEVEKVVLDALEVKFWDRLDNLETSEVYYEYNEKNAKKAKRKIQETEKYFIKIALEFDNLMGTYFSTLILIEIEKLKSYIFQKEKEEVSQCSQQKIGTVL